MPTIKETLAARGISPEEVKKFARKLEREAYAKEKPQRCTLRGGPWNGQETRLTPNMGGSLVIRVAGFVGHYDSYGNWRDAADSTPARRVQDADGRWQAA